MRTFSTMVACRHRNRDGRQRRKGVLVMRCKRFKMQKHCLIVLFVATWASGLAWSQAATSKVDFRRDVQPLLKQFCIECHGPSLQQHGFRLDRRHDAMRGGTSTVIVPGNSAASRL